MPAHRDGVSHWDEVYAGGDASRSWFQARPRMSLTMLDAAGVTASDSLIDVGGGASRLAGALLDRGFRDVTVLDISATGCGTRKIASVSKRSRFSGWLLTLWRGSRRGGSGSGMTGRSSTS